MAYSIDYIYRISDRFSSVMRRMGTSATRFDAGITRMQTGLRNLSGRFQATGAKLANLQTGLASLGAGAFLKGALTESMAFQRSLNMTKAVTGSTAEQMDLMRNKALEWGSQTQFSSGAVAQAMAELGKMGNKTNDILALMPGTMALAAAGEISMGEAANFSMGILNQFGLKLDQATNVADILAKGASGAATSVGGLASAMNNTGLQASMAGLSIGDTTAALMAMASKNLEGAEAGTMMMNTLKSLQVMPAKVREGFGKMGIDIDKFRDTTTGQMTDFWGLIEAMKEAGATGAQLGSMFDVRAMKGMAVLVGTTTEEINSFREQVSDSSGASKEMADTLKEGLGPMIEFQSIMQNLKVIVGTFVAEAITPLLKRFNKWMGDMQKNNPRLLKFITYMLMGVTAIGAILIPLGLIISTIGSLIGVIAPLIGLIKLWTLGQLTLNAVMSANPIALVIIGIAALIAITIIVIKYWDQIVVALKSAWKWMVDVYDAVKGLAFIYGGPLAMALIFVIETIRSVINNFAEIKAAFTDQGFYAGITSLSKAIFIGLIEPFTAVYDLIMNIKDKIVGVVSGVKDFFTGGGEEAASPYASKSQNAPTMGRSRGMESTANASVSVYAEKGLSVEPFEASGDLGYNMTGTSRRR